MIIHSKFKNYEVKIEKSLEFLSDVLNTDNAEFVVDKKVYYLYEQILERIPQERLILIEAVEENKIIETALSICEKMTEIPAKRNASMISMGGVIQDITGFAANILYRGIKWIFIPTTLLACCDSCIGGKTSLNYKNYKNLLGTFYPPDVIYICPAFLHTLDRKDFYSGLGEVIKFNIMAGEAGLNNIELYIDKLLECDEIVINRFVESSLLFKKEFIEIDEFDRGERIKLNFAHTFGHAIETVTKYEIPHGTAVAIGMIMADYISVSRGILKEEISKRVEKVLLQVICIDVELTGYPVEDFIVAIRKDKKQTNENLTAVLMTNVAKDLKIVHDISEVEVIDAITHFASVYSVYKS